MKVTMVKACNESILGKYESLAEIVSQATHTQNLRKHIFHPQKKTNSCSLMKLFIVHNLEKENPPQIMRQLTCTM